MSKQIFKYIYIILLIILIFFLQLFLVNDRELFGIKPNFILILVIVFNLWFGLYKGVAFASVIGIICDLVFGNNNAMFFLSYTITSALIGLINFSYNRTNKISLVFVTILFTTIFELVQYVVFLIITSGFISFIPVIKNIIVGSILNIIIVYIVYGVIFRIKDNYDSKKRRDMAI